MKYPFALTTQYSSMNLNDLTKYELMDFDLGDTVQDEAWIESYYVTAPILSQSAARKSKIRLTLKVFGRLTPGGTNSHANLVTNIEAVRNEFYRNNTLTWSYDGGATSHQVQTFKSALSPIPVQGDRGLIILRDHIALGWEFEVTRHPFEINQSAPLVI